MSCDYSLLKDEQLLSLIDQGQRGAFSELVKRHTTKFYRVAFRMLNTKEDAEDAVQDCFLKLWATPGMWKKDKGAKFTTWFYRVVINKCQDMLKRKKEKRLEDGFDITDESDSAEDGIYNNYKARTLEESLGELSDNQKKAIILSFYEYINNKEAAKIMGLSLKAFQSLLMRGKKTLKEKLIAKGGM